MSGVGVFPYRTPKEGERRPGPLEMGPVLNKVVVGTGNGLAQGKGRTGVGGGSQVKGTI